MPKFLKEHKKNLKKLTKKQLIQQILNHIEITAQIERQFNDSYEELFQESLQHKREKENIKIELSETQEALSRSRNHIEIYKEQIERHGIVIKRLERGITNTWFISDWCEGITEVLPGGIDEGMIEYKIIDKEQKKYILLIK